MGNATCTRLSAALPNLFLMCLPTPREIPAFRGCTSELQAKARHRRPASVPIPALRALFVFWRGGLCHVSTAQRSACPTAILVVAHVSRPRKHLLNHVSMKLPPEDLENREVPLQARILAFPGANPARFSQQVFETLGGSTSGSSYVRKSHT